MVDALVVASEVVAAVDAVVVVGVVEFAEDEATVFAARVDLKHQASHSAQVY